MACCKPGQSRLAQPREKSAQRGSKKSKMTGFWGKGWLTKLLLQARGKCLKCKILAFDLLRDVPETVNSSLPLLSLFLIPEALQALDNFRGSTDKCTTHRPDSSQGIHRPQNPGLSGEIRCLEDFQGAKKGGIYTKKKREFLPEE